MKFKVGNERDKPIQVFSNYNECAEKLAISTFLNADHESTFCVAGRIYYPTQYHPR